VREQLLWELLWRIIKHDPVIGIHYPCSWKQPRCQLKVRINQKVVTQPFSSFVLFAWQCKHAPNTIKFYLKVCPKSKCHNLYMWAKGKLHHNPIWHVQSSNKFFFVVGQSNWLLANFGCPISSPNPHLPSPSN
jgi:hypothetical protein